MYNNNNIKNEIKYAYFLRQYDEKTKSLNLPDDVTHLYYDYDLNEPFEKQLKLIPKTIIHIIFDYKFNLPINKLHNSITHLTLRSGFKRSQLIYLNQ